jgi:hypothetical protein
MIRFLTFSLVALCGVGACTHKQRIETLTDHRLAQLIKTGRGVVKAPVGYFPRAPLEYRYRLLCIDGDGLGGIALGSLAAKRVRELHALATKKKTGLWLTVSGTLRQYLTKDQLDRSAAPDAIFVEARVVRTNHGPRPQFEKEREK